MTSDDAERAIVAPLAPPSPDAIVTKSRYSAFHRTALAATMRELARDQLIVCGVFAHLGCLLTACDAYAHDIEPFLVADAMADFSPRITRWRWTSRRAACAATPTTARVLAWLSGSGSG